MWEWRKKESRFKQPTISKDTPIPVIEKIIKLASMTGRTFFFLALVCIILAVVTYFADGIARHWFPEWTQSHPTEISVLEGWHVKGGLSAVFVFAAMVFGYLAYKSRDFTVK